MATPTTDITFADVQEVFDRALLLEDRDYIRLVAATILANQLDGAPVWLLIVAPPSGGKTAVLMTFDDLELMPGKKNSFFISDLTENTFASGFKSNSGDSGLLMQMPLGGMLIFKDFTSILTKRHEARDAIMGQLREIYDRKFDKRTGNNQDTAWKGKVGALAGVTMAVHEYMSEMSVMGDRFIMYSPKQPERMKLLRFIMEMKVNGNTQEANLDKAKVLMHQYLKRCVKILGNTTLQMKEDDREHLMHVADFATKVRSGVIIDQRTKQVEFVPDQEMPTRLIEQLLSIGTVLCAMREADGEESELSESDMKVLYKIAFDSIPIKRRWALRELASYAQGATTAGLATKIGYETSVVGNWLAQLSALGVCRRLKNNGGADTWALNEEYSEVMYTFENVLRKPGILEDEFINQDDFLAEQALRSADLETEFL